MNSFRGKHFVVLAVFVLLGFHMIGCLIKELSFNDMWRWFVWGYTGSGIYAGFFTMETIAAALGIFALVAGVRFLLSKHRTQAESILTSDTKDKHPRYFLRGFGFLAAYLLLGAIYNLSFYRSGAGALTAFVAFIFASLGVGFLGYAMWRFSTKSIF